MKYLLLLLTLFSGVACQEKDKKVLYRDVSSTSITPTESARVTQDFGALKVSEGDFTGTTKIIPWSSWWFPTKDSFLFLNENSNELAPLQKYDLYVEKTQGESPASALFEQMEIYDPSEVNWAGLCHAWAVASVLHVEPRFNVMRKEINLSVGDQKALILKSYENVGDLKIYGSRYNGEFNDKFEDVYPDQFHRFVQVHLFEKKMPFLMDYDPSFPVWTVPVYNIKFKIEKISESSASVKAWVTIVSPFVDSPNFVGTKKSVKAYEYNLSGKWVGEELHVTSSEWINESKFDHPDFLIAYPTGVKRSSLNKKIDNKLVDEMVGLKFVENAQP